ncbi:hypothetical protein ACI6CX_01450 [Mammaliicoccus sciuri]|uniref:hypothetical protein n=1 Tax=Mammaliicoccus sciuri TaxID=1296 RepID=UPI003851ED81
MPTIKTKKEMTLSELVEYGFNNPQKIRGKMFKPQSFDLFWNPANVWFSEDGCAVNVNGSVTDEDVYTVEIEEEITEDTKLFKLYHLTEYGFWEIKLYRSINDVKTDKSLAFYVMSDDLTMTLIWKNGKLVE